MRVLHKGAAVIIGCLILTLAFIAPPVMRGDEWNLATKFSIDHPFQVPGMVLQPNTRYVIRLHDSPSNRTVVQIYDEDQQHMLTMFMGISDERLEPVDHTVFTFVETQPGYPVPVKEWFYPGRLHGLEFIYPKDQALEIARHGRESVLTESAANITKSESTAVFEEKPVEPEPLPEAKAEPQPEVQLEPEPAAPEQIAQNEPPVQPQVQEEQPAPAPSVTEEKELPATAGELPLIALAGLMCLGAGVGLRVISSKS
jgi:hypothetical protein